MKTSLLAVLALSLTVFAVGCAEPDDTDAVASTGAALAIHAAPKLVAEPTARFAEPISDLAKASLVAGETVAPSRFDGPTPVGANVTCTAKNELLQTCCLGHEPTTCCVTWAEGPACDPLSR